jgi:hypothetical protein
MGERSVVRSYSAPFFCLIFGYLFRAWQKPCSSCLRNGLALDCYNSSLVID